MESVQRKEGGGLLLDKLCQRAKEKRKEGGNACVCVCVCVCVGTIKSGERREEWNRKSPQGNEPTTRGGGERRERTTTTPLPRLPPKPREKPTHASNHSPLLFPYAAANFLKHFFSSLGTVAA